MLDGAYTLPQFRGRGLLSAVERAILDDAKREDQRHAYTHVALDNVASLRGVMKTGFRPVGVLDWRWVLGAALVRYEESLISLAELLL
jgi:RimJ/RimL family protein N-acetyltransferase